MNCDIEIEIARVPGSDEYRVHVLRAAAGGEPEAMLRLDVKDVLSGREDLENTLLASATSARRAVSTSELTVREVGQRLFEALFAGPVHGAYYASLGVAQKSGKRLRVVLRLTDPKLAALPWEMLYDPERGKYLCRQEPLVRRVPAPFTVEPLRVPAPLRVLGLIASPRGWPRLDVDLEIQNLEVALAGPIADGLVSLTWVEPATWDSVQARLLAGEWHVVHFIGHGDYDDVRNKGLLAFVSPEGHAHMVEAGELADLLGEAEPSPRLVVLNSCSGGEVGGNDLLSSTAAALVDSGIDAVAAMQFAVSDDAAIAFSRGFYTAIASGRGVDAAARSGRINILRSPGTLEWVTPVLYLRGDATHPIAIESGSVEIDSDLPHLESLYDEALTELQLGHHKRSVHKFDELLKLRPGYRDAATLQEAALNADESDALYDAAVKELDDGKLEKAEALFDVLLNIDPGYRDAAALRDYVNRGLQAEALYERASAELEAGHFDTALRVFDELEHARPGHRDAAALRETAQRELELEALYGRASGELAAGHFQTALQLFNDLLNDKPDYRDAVALRDAASRGLKRKSWRERLAGFVATNRRWAIPLIVVAVVGALGVGSLSLSGFPPWGDGDDPVLGDDELVLTAKESGSRRQIVRVNVRTGEVSPIETEAAGARRPNVSPDRSQIVYLAETGKSKLTVPHLIRVDGTDDRPLFESPDRPCETTKRPAWSPEGDRIAVVCDEGGRGTSLYVVGLDGHQISELIPDEVGIDLGPPTWGENGQIVLWRGSAEQVDEKGGELVSVVEGGEDSPTPLTDGFDAHPDWFDDALVFVHYEAGDNVIQVLRGGPIPKSVPGTTGDVDSPTWSPDGSEIAYLKRDSTEGAWQLWVTDPDGDDGRPIELDIGEVEGPVWGSR